MALTTNLLSWWHNDTNSNDSVGSSNGTDTSMTYGSPYKSIGAGQFDGSASTQRFSVALGSAGSFNLWFKRSDTTTNVTSILGATTIGVHDYLRIAPSNANINMQVMDDNKNYAWTVDTNWHMLTIVWDGSTAWEGYLDGTKVITGSGVKNPTGNTYIRTGIVDDNGTPYTSGQTYYKGALDEVGYWNRRLSGSEITQLYASGSGFFYPFTTTYNQTVAATGTGIASVKKQMSKTLATTALGVASVKKGLSKTIAVVGIGIATTLKQMNVLIDVVALGIANISASRAYLQVIDVVATGIADMTYIPNKLMNVVALGVVGIKKDFAKTIDTVALGVVDIDKGLSKMISVVAVGTVTVTKEMAKTISVTATGVTHVFKSVLVSIDVVAQGVIDLAILRMKDIAVIATGVASISKTPHKMIAVIANAIVYISKGSPWKRQPKETGTWTRQPKP